MGQPCDGQGKVEEESSGEEDEEGEGKEGEGKEGEGKDGEWEVVSRSCKRR